MLFSEKDKKEQRVEQALLQNYNKYFRLAYSYTENESDAADIVQNGAYKAILNSDSLKNAEYAETWIYRIMINETFRFLKREKSLSYDRLDAESGAEDVYENLDLKRALDSMSQADKAVIQLKYFEDMKLQEIAEVLGENVSTIKSRLYRGLRKLRVELSDT